MRHWLSLLSWRIANINPMCNFDLLIDNQTIKL